MGGLARFRLVHWEGGPRRDQRLGPVPGIKEDVDYSPAMAEPKASCQQLGLAWGRSYARAFLAVFFVAALRERLWRLVGIWSMSVTSRRPMLSGPSANS